MSKGQGWSMLRKKDIMFVVVVLLVAGAMAVFFRCSNMQEGELVRIMVDGKEYGSYVLTENKKIEIRNSLGENRIVIKDNMVYMEHADCPDQYCVKHKAISKTNETIVCLPHKLVVELHEKKTEEDFDSIAQ